MGVFATRSPFRPNAIGLSSVRLDGVELQSKLGPVLHVSGIDLMDTTPIFDIKPYLSYTDSHPQATEGFTQIVDCEGLQVAFPPELLTLIPPNQREALIGVLAHDPRPRYQDDPERIYGFAFDRWNVQFTVNGSLLTVVNVTPL